MEPPKKYKILLVEDDTFIRQMYEITFRKAGIDLITLPHAGGDFVQKVLEVNPDLVSLDIIMPERDGYEAIKLLKQDERTKNIAVIFLNNLGQPENIQKGLSLGAVDYLITARYEPKQVVEIYLSYLKDPTHYIPQQKVLDKK